MDEGVPSASLAPLIILEPAPAFTPPTTYTSFTPDRSISNPTLAPADASTVMGPSFASLPTFAPISTLQLINWSEKVSLSMSCFNPPFIKPRSISVVNLLQSDLIVPSPNLISLWYLQATSSKLASGPPLAGLVGLHLYWVIDSKP